MTVPESIHAQFDHLRTLTDPRGHELLASIEELVTEAVDASRTIAAHVAVLEHEQRLARLIEAYGRNEAAERPGLRSVS